MKTSIISPAPRRLLTGWLAGAALLASLAGCAVGPVNQRDPFEAFNRKALQFNEGVDSLVLKPAATVYRERVPPLVRTGVSNFFGNLSDLWSSANSALQFKFRNSAENFMRFNVNTLFGVFGIFDVASEFNIERHREDFGQTLGHWGVPSGPFIMLPLLGPSTLRDTLAITIDRRGDPVHYVNSFDTRYELYTLRAVDQRSNALRVGDMLEAAALDKYSFIRDAHMQRRRAEITDAPPPGVAGDATSEPRYDLPAPGPAAAPASR